jgi:HAE1 family hydrophobic/amphiphilic exporter-1/multidrug efflux pump
VCSSDLVVDDAIVVLENVERLMAEQKLTPRAAAHEAMREVSSAVVAIVLVLCAVFIPVAFLGGIAGRLYQQFAVTVAVAVVISGVVALTLTPALCALLLKPSHEEAPLFRPFNRLFARFTKSYLWAVDKTLHHRIIGGTVFALVIGLGVLLLLKVPGSFVPSEDQGYLVSSLRLPEGATLDRTTKTGGAFRDGILSHPDVDHVFLIGGFDFIGGSNKPNAASMFINLKPWDERKTVSEDLAKQFMGRGMMLPDGMGLVFNPAPIRGLGSAGGFEFYLQDRVSGDPKRLAEVLNNFIETLKQKKELTGITTFFRPTTPQLYVDVDESKAISLGVPVSDIYESLQSTMGALYVNDFNKAGRTYRVQLQADAAYRSRPEDLGRVHVRSATSGAMIPLSALIHVRPITGPEQIERFNGFLAAKVLGSGAPGVASGDAILQVEEAAASLPEGYSIAWSGQAYQEKRTGSSSAKAFGFALIMVFLILAAQFEKWSLPLAVIMAVPFALLGALVAVMIRGMPNDIYFQIGLVTLIGLASKNAILIVEFANQKYSEGMDIMQAALEAARLRFRPIIMTSLAFVLGVLPLVLATGAGAGARRSMGTGVFGGMIAATFIATIFIPMFFTWLSRRKAKRVADQEEVKEEAE